MTFDTNVHACTRCQLVICWMDKCCHLIVKQDLYGGVCREFYLFFLNEMQFYDSNNNLFVVRLAVKPQES